MVLAREIEAETAIIRRVVERNRRDALIRARTRPEAGRIHWLEERGLPFAAIGQTRSSSHGVVDRDGRRIGREVAEAPRGAGPPAQRPHLTAPWRHTYGHHAREGWRRRGPPPVRRSSS